MSFTFLYPPPERVWRSTWLDFSSQGPPFTSVVDTLSSGGKVPLKEGRDELDFWLVLATIGKKGKSSPPGLEALLEIYGSSVKRRPSWSLNSTTTTSLQMIPALFQRGLSDFAL